MAQSITDLRVGRLVKIDNEPFIIVSNSFMRTAQRKPVMRTKLKGIISGKALEKTFIAGESFDIVEIERMRAQYMYKDADSAYFMNMENYDQFGISLELVGDAIKYMKDGDEIMVTEYEGKSIGVELPPKVNLKVTETTPGVKGDTAQGGTKPAMLETGLVIQVPLFITEGALIRINTETGEYVERVQ